jgi:uncharacterized protein YyaL (SSP411 family)
VFGRNSFIVTALTVVLLSLLGILATSTRSFIEPVTVNRLGEERDPLLRAARYSPMLWRSLHATPTPLQLARQDRKPMLVYISAPWSAHGRSLDRYFFGNGEVAASLATRFICVRIDGAQDRAWLGALLPQSRLSSDFRYECQLIVLSAEGRLAGFSRLMAERGNPDRNQLLSEVIELHRRALSNDQPDPVLETQETDVAWWQNPTVPGGVFSVSAYLARATVRREEEPGLIPQWHLLNVRLGPGPDAARELDRLLARALFDPIDGGFYRKPQNNGLGTQFDKVATENVEMMEALAIAAVLLERSDYRKAVQITFDYLFEDLNEDGILLGRQGDGGRNGRSGHSSYRYLELLENLSDAELTFARERLSLRLGENRQMVPTLQSPLVLDMPEFDLVRAKLRALPTAPEDRIPARMTETEGLVVARGLRTAVLLNDDVRLGLALDMVDGLDAFIGEDGPERIVPFDGRPATLHAWVALAEAYLEAFLATGRVPYLDRAHDLLGVAFNRFRIAPGVWRTLPEAAPPVFPGAVTVETSDMGRESAMAQAARVLFRFARVQRDSSVARRGEPEAFSILARTGVLAAVGDPVTAGLANAAAELVDDTYFVVVGPNAVETGLQLRRLRPNHLVVPAVGPAAREHQGKGPGVYVVRAGEATGPLTLRAVAAQIPAYLNAGQ